MRPRIALPFLFGSALALFGGAVSPVRLAAPAPVAAAALESEAYAFDLYDRINTERIANGMAPLAYTGDAAAVAAARALDMAGSGYFAHTSPAGVGVSELLRAFGVHFRMMGENIAYSTYPSPGVVEQVHTMLMDSPGHRANTLNPRYGRVGIGVATAGEAFYFAIVFLD